MASFVVNVREEMNENNLKNALSFIRGKSTSKVINKKESERVSSVLKMSQNQLNKKAKNDKVFEKLLAYTISKKAQRQGIIVETRQFSTLQQKLKECIETKECIVTKYGGK